MRSQVEAIGNDVYIISYFCPYIIEASTLCPRGEEALKAMCHRQQAWLLFQPSLCHPNLHYQQVLEINLVLYPQGLSVASQNSNQLALMGECCPILTPLSYQINHSQFKTST